VDEHILAPVSRDEAKAFRIVEPLDGSGLTTHLRDLVKGLVTRQQENFSENNPKARSGYRSGSAVVTFGITRTTQMRAATSQQVAAATRCMMRALGARSAT